MGSEDEDEDDDEAAQLGDKRLKTGGAHPSLLDTLDETAAEKIVGCLDFSSVVRVELAVKSGEPLAEAATAELDRPDDMPRYACPVHLRGSLGRSLRAGSESGF